jgi:hypothetical protein
MKVFLLAVIFYISFGIGSKVSFENFQTFVTSAKSIYLIDYGPGRKHSSSLSLTSDFQAATESFLNSNSAVEILKAFNRLDYKNISFFLFFWIHYRTGERTTYLPYVYRTSVQFKEALYAFLSFIKVKLFLLSEDERITLIDYSLEIFYKIRIDYTRTYTIKNSFFIELEREFQLLSQWRAPEDPYSLLLYEYSIFTSKASLPRAKSNFYFLIKYFLKKETEKTCDNVLIWLSCQRIEFINCFLHLNYYNYVDNEMLDKVSKRILQPGTLFKSFNSIIPIFQFDIGSSKWIKSYNPEAVKLSDPLEMDHYLDLFHLILNQSLFS